MNKTETKIEKMFDEVNEITDKVVEESTVTDVETEKNSVDFPGAQDSPIAETNVEPTKEEAAAEETESENASDEAETVTDVESTKEEAAEETESENVSETKDSLFNEICVLLEKSNRYSHLACGRFIKDELTPKTIKEFYMEFKNWGELSHQEDNVIMKKLSQYFE